MSNSRRSFLRVMVAGSVALAVLVVPALAEELLGRITKVDTANKKIVVTANGSDKEVEITVNDDTEYVSGKGETSKIDLEKLSKRLEKAKRGPSVKVTHDKGVASKVEAVAKKKGGGR